MDNRRLILLVFISTALMLLWMIGIPWAARQFGYDLTGRAEQAPQEVVQPTTQPDPLASDAVDTPSTAPAIQAAPTTQAAPGTLRVLTSAEPRAIVLGSAEPGDPTYGMQLSLSNVGAGIEEVVLNDFELEVGESERYRFQQPYPDQPNATRPLATAGVTVQGQTVDLSRVAWAVDEERSGPDDVVFYVELGTEAGPVARVEKLIRLYPRQTPEQPPRGGYELLVRQTIINLTDAPLPVATSINGPTVPPKELEYGYDRMVIAGYRGRNTRVTYEAYQVESLREEDSRRELVVQGGEPLLWAGTSSIYFNAIIRPEPLERTAVPGGDVDVPDYIQQVVAASLNPQEQDDERLRVAMRLHTTPREIEPGGSLALPLRVYMGPKDRDLLNNPYYSAAGVRYNETLVSPFGCTWCVFQPVVDVLVWLLTGFYAVFRDWGLAIIALVVVVRLLLHPITKRSQRSMMRMARLAPEMEKLKKKYGDDKDAMAKAMGEFYREHGMAALPLGCLPLLLQTPIWIALYSMLQAELRLRGAPFLYGWTWIDDLAQPDNLLDFGVTINLLLFSIHGINLLPLLLGVVFWVQMKFQPTPAAMTPEQKMQQTMMKWMMVLMFPLFLYKAPSGLNLYILTSTLIGIWESKRVRDQFKREEEEKAAEAPELVPDKAPRTARAKKEQREREQAKQKPQLTGWRAKWSQLKEQVHQAQEEAAKRAGERGKGKR